MPAAAAPMGLTGRLSRAPARCSTARRCSPAPKALLHSGGLPGERAGRQPPLLRLGRHLQHPAARDRRPAARPQGRQPEWRRRRTSSPAGNIGCLTQIATGRRERARGPHHPADRLGPGRPRPRWATVEISRGRRSRPLEAGAGRGRYARHRADATAHGRTMKINVAAGALAAVLGLTAASAALAQSPPPPPTEAGLPQLALANLPAKGGAKLTVSTPAFKAGADIPLRQHPVPGQRLPGPDLEQGPGLHQVLRHHHAGHRRRRPRRPGAALDRVRHPGLR